MPERSVLYAGVGRHTGGCDDADDRTLSGLGATRDEAEVSQVDAEVFDDTGRPVWVSHFLLFADRADGSVQTIWNAGNRRELAVREILLRRRGGHRNSA